MVGVPRLGFIISALWCSLLNVPTSASTLPVPTDDDPLQKLTLDEKAGALMMIGIPGKVLTPKAKTWIQKRGLGGIIFFPKNIGAPKEIKTLTSAIQKSAPHAPVLIAIDQEGGRVRRIQKDVTFMPSAMSLGSADSPSLSYLSGMVMGKELLHLGISVNLAPVLDVYTSNQENLIGTRSFGPSTRTVTNMGGAYVRALQFHGVSATAKHFPGHGNVNGDSHFTLPHSDIGFDQWLKNHMPPFKEAIDEDVHLIMTAHVRFPEMLKDLGAPESEQQLPATLSKTLINDVLRKRLKFRGVVLTDDLEMHAIQKKWSYGEAAVRAIEAGSDMVMVAWGNEAKEDVWKSLKEAIRSGRLSEERIHESLRRTFRIRRSKGSAFDLEQSDHILRNPLHQEAATLIRTRGLAAFETTRAPAIQNLELPKDATIIAYSSHASLVEELQQELQGHFQSPPLTAALDQFPTKQTSDAPENRIHLVFLRNQRDKNTLGNRWSAQRSKPQEKVVVISMESPYLLTGFEDADGLLCTFNNDFLSLKSLTAFIKNAWKLSVSRFSLKNYR